MITYKLMTDIYENDCKDVLIRIYRTDDGEDIIIIETWQDSKECPLYFSRTLDFGGDFILMSRYIATFDHASAVDFIHSVLK